MKEINILKCEAGKNNKCGNPTKFICYNNYTEFPICKEHMEKLKKLQEKYNRSSWKFKKARPWCVFKND